MYLCFMNEKPRTDKAVKIRQIGKISNRLDRFTPISHSFNPLLYIVLHSKFLSCMKWPETRKIPRLEFERALHHNPDLVDAYLDVFSPEAEFYLSLISYDQVIYHYCIMIKNNTILLLYFRKIEFE